METIEEFEIQREKFTRLFRQYIKQNDHYCDILDFLDYSEPKYFIYYNGATEEIEIGEDYEEKKAFQVYASNEKVLREAIDFIGEENIKKYILEIEDRF